MKQIDVGMAITRHSETGEFLIIEKAEEYIEEGGRYDKTPWEVPGGKIEDGETPEEAAVRELKEETSLEAEVRDSTADFYENVQVGQDYKVRFYPVLLEVKEKEVSLSEEHEGFHWLESHLLDDYLTSHEIQAFEKLGLY